MTWDEFEMMLVSNGWDPTEAAEERKRQETGWQGDCDGDLEV